MGAIICIVTRYGGFQEVVILAFIYIYLFIYYQATSFFGILSMMWQKNNKTKQKRGIMLDKGSWLRPDRKTVVREISKMSNGWSRVWNIVTERQVLNLENFVTGRLLKVIAILFRKWLSLGALGMLTFVRTEDWKTLKILNVRQKTSTGKLLSSIATPLTCKTVSNAKCLQKS